MKKIISITMLFIIFLNITTISFADDLDEENISIEDVQEEILETSTITETVPKTNSRAVLIYDRTSRQGNV